MTLVKKAKNLHFSALTLKKKEKEINILDNFFTYNDLRS